MDGILKKFPEVLFKDASPRPNQINFHVRTRDACAESSIKILIMDGMDGKGAYPSTEECGLKTSKCVVIGDLGVGKTSIINRYCRNVFEKDYKPTIGVEYEVRRYEILKTQFQLQIWDTSGEERFKSITAAYYRGSNAIMVTFDLTESLSLTHARSWLDEALNNTRTTVPEIFLVGNKKDSCKSRQLEEIRKEAKAVCEEMNAEYWEVSAKSGENVKDLFTRISAICFDQAVLRELEDQKVKTEKVKLGGGSANNGLQTIQLGKLNLEQAENSKSKRGCCKSS